MKKITSIILMLATISFLLVGCTQLVVGALNQIEMTQVSVQGNKIYLMGDFNSKSYDQVRTAISTNPGVKTVVLTANSGSLDDETTFKLGRLLRSKGLNTHLLGSSVIASGAVDLFLAGVNRTIEKGAKLGVHSWSDGSKQAKDFPRHHPDHSLNSGYIKDMLGVEDFYWFTIYSAPADSIYWMKDEEIIKHKMVTAPFLSPSNDKTPFGKDFTAMRKDILED